MDFQLIIPATRDIIHIRNNGGDLASTNYGQTAMAKQGAIYVSVNVKTIRLLMIGKVADQIQTNLGDAKYAIISYSSNDPIIEILFEDNSSEPFMIHLGKSSFSTLPIEQKREDLVIACWATDGTRIDKRLAMPCKLRKVSTVPYGLPWGM